MFNFTDFSLAERMLKPYKKGGDGKREKLGHSGIFMNGKETLDKCSFIDRLENAVSPLSSEMREPLGSGVSKYHVTGSWLF